MYSDLIDSIYIECFFFSVIFSILHYLFFFFSSRRRHTRYWRDWSSDVCSSDLAQPITGATAGTGRTTTFGRIWRTRRSRCTSRRARVRSRGGTSCAGWRKTTRRSEERRVGKEGGSGWGGDSWREE